MRRLIPLAAVLLITLPVFSQSVIFLFIQVPQGMSIVGDFNADGREDGILFTGGGTSFHLFTTANTAGAYAPSTSYTLPNGESERGYTVGDFNKDGKLDLAIATSASNLHVYRGNGDGTFEAPTTLSLPFVPSGMLAADVNHDGKMDVVLLNAPGGSQGSSVVTYFGNGSGGFSAGPSSPFGFLYSLNASGDFDGDGKVDLFSANCGPGGCEFFVYYGDSTGRFGSPATASANQANPTVADVDGDGKSDIITSTMGYINSTDQPYLSVFYGAGNRTLQFGKVPTSECTFGRPVVADFNGDHVPDIMFPQHDCSVTSTSSAQIAFLAGKGNRTFGPEERVFDSTYEQQPGPDTTVLRANNSDAKPDILFSQSGSTIVLENLSSGTFAGCRAANTATGFHICSPASGSTVASPVKFSFGAAWQVPVRKTEVWVDGVKKVQSRYAFSRYGFLDVNVALTPGTHAITVVGAGWDNSIESKKYSIVVH